MRETGGVAITNHATVEMVLVDAATRQWLATGPQAIQARGQSVLNQLNAQFKQCMAVLQAPEAANKVNALFQCKGKLEQRPKAGVSF